MIIVLFGFLIVATLVGRVDLIVEWVASAGGEASIAMNLYAPQKRSLIARKIDFLNIGLCL